MARKLFTAASKHTGVRKKSPRPVVPQAAVSSPIGYFSNSSNTPPSNIGSYGMISTEANVPSGFTGQPIVYRTSITCQSGVLNMSQAECTANNWQMTDASGNLTNAGFGGVLGDPGLVGYQQRWCELAYARAQQSGAKGFWMDDSTPRLDAVSGGRWPTKYPNQDAYRNALESFFSFTKNYMGARGMKTCPNTGVPQDNTGALTASWWQRVAPVCHYLSIEFWMYNNGLNRRVGGEWWNNWNGFRNLHVVCQNGGAGFFPLSEGGDATTANWSLATFMLDWNGRITDGTSVWMLSNIGSSDPWTSFYAQAKALGWPTAAATQTSLNVWSRQFQNGTLTANANTATATITGV